MSFRISLDAQNNCCFVCHPTYVPAEGLQAINMIVADPAFKPGISFLRDTRDIRLPAEMNYDWFKKDFDSAYTKEHLLMQGSRFAWLVSSPADYAKAHAWALVTRTTQGQNRLAFRNLEQALDWLGLPAGYEIDYGPLLPEEGP